MDMFPTLLIILVITMGSGAVPYATLSPVHLTTDHRGLTILMCLVHDIRQGEMEVAWISSGTRGFSPAGYNLLKGEDGIQSAMSVISVASSDWTSFTCFVSHKVTDQLIHRHYAGFPKETTETYDVEMFNEEETSDTCLDYQSSLLQEVKANSDLLFVQALRILLVKITIFNVLMTVQVVIKCANNKRCAKIKFCAKTEEKKLDTVMPIYTIGELQTSGMRMNVADERSYS